MVKKKLVLKQEVKDLLFEEMLAGCLIVFGLIFSYVLCLIF